MTTTTANPETLFPPRPGGMVEKARQQKAQDTAAQQQQSARPQPTPKGQVSYTPIRVNSKTPENASFRTVVVSTSGQATAQLCGQSPNRKDVTIYTVDEPVVIGQLAQMSDAANAVNAAGLPCSGAALPAYPYFITIETQAEIWVTATSSTATRVVAIETIYADPAT